MASAAQVRREVEEALAARAGARSGSSLWGHGGARLELGPRLVCDGVETGYGTLDAVLRGGLPVAGTSEIVGSRSSGRATVAAAYVAERSREGHVCAWVDVAGDMSPEALLVNGMDAERVLFVRCGGGEAVEARGVQAEVRVDEPVVGIYLSGKYVSEAGRRAQRRKEKAIGTPGMPNRALGEGGSDASSAQGRAEVAQGGAQGASEALGQAVTGAGPGPQPAASTDFFRGVKPVVSSGVAGCGRPGASSGAAGFGKPGASSGQVRGKRVEQINSDRQPARRGSQVMAAAEERGVERVGARVDGLPATSAKRGFVQGKKPWTRLEQAMKAVDLLVQGGGFGVIVLDLGGIAPQHVRRIPLATWFRWRAALERTRTSLLVLSQMGLAGSAAELVLRVEAEMPKQGTVLTGVGYRLEVVRRRFAEDSVEGRRKGPGRAGAGNGSGASGWESRAVWA